MNSAKYSYNKEVYEPFSQENKLGEVLVKGVQKSKFNSHLKTVASKRKAKTLFEECPNSQCSQCPESLSDQIISADMKKRSSEVHTPEKVVSADLKKRSVDYDSGDDFVTPPPKKLATGNKGKRDSKIKKSGKKNLEKTPKILIHKNVVIKEGNIGKTLPLSGVECLSEQPSPKVLPLLKDICENFDPNLGGNVEVSPPGFKEYSQEVNPDSENYHSQDLFKSLMEDALENVKKCEEKLASQNSNLDETDIHLRSLADAQNLATGELRRRFDVLVNGSAAQEEDIGNPPSENSGGGCQTEGKNLKLELLKAKRDIVLARKKYHLISFEIEKREFERKEREYRKGLDLLEKELSDLDADISRS